MTPSLTDHGITSTPANEIADDDASTKSPQPLVSSTLFEGDRRITLEIERAGRQAQLVTARNCNSVLHIEEIRLSRSDDRAKFVAAIPDRDKAERDVIGKELIQLLDQYRATQQINDAEDDGKDSAATRLVRLAEGVKLIHNSDGDGFAVLNIDDHKETYALRSKGFKRWLVRRFFECYEKAPGSQAVQDALAVIEGRAVYDGDERKIFVRVGEQNGKIYLDLADDNWRAVEIDSAGWRVVATPPIEFRRAKGMLPLPVPEPGGSIEELRPFLSLKDGDLWTLMLGSLVMKLRPRGPYNVDVFTGGQGCGKTTRARVIRSLVDPSSADTRSAPRELRDLQIAATNEWLPVFDNLSRIPEWLSDGFCCLSTGGGMRTRELYSDNEESIFATMRPLILTSITEVVERPDLLDRSIIFNLPEIKKEDRKPEKLFWTDFEQARPRILGALLDAVSCALRREDSITLKETSRLADFERWATAAEPALGLKAGSFVAAYRENQTSANELALEASPITNAFVIFVESQPIEQQPVWNGTARELFDRLTADLSDDEIKRRRDQGFPKAANSLSAALRRLAPNLRDRGIDIEFGIRRDPKGSRKINIYRRKVESEPASQTSPEDYFPETSSDTVRPSDLIDFEDFTAEPSDDPDRETDDV